MLRKERTLLNAENQGHPRAISVLWNYIVETALPKASVDKEAQAEWDKIAPLEGELQRSVRSERNALEREIVQLTEWLYECKRQETCVR